MYSWNPEKQEFFVAVDCFSEHTSPPQSCVTLYFIYHVFSVVPCDVLRMNPSHNGAYRLSSSSTEIILGQVKIKLPRNARVSLLVQTSPIRVP